MKRICPNCGKDVKQEIVAFRETKRGMEYTLKCKNCGYTYKIIEREEKMIDIKVVWSWHENSEIKKFTAFEDDMIAVGDEININGINSLVTAIDAHGKRVKEAKAKDIDTLWAKRFDRIILKISVNRGNRTSSYEIEVTPDEEFYVGDMLDLEDIHAVIHKIKTEDRFVNRGGAQARNIVRIYAKEIREVGRKH